MSIKAAVYSRATGYAGLTALVSTRISTGHAPHSQTTPYVVFYLVNNERISAMSADSSIARALIQFSIFSDTPEDLDDVADQLRGAFQRWSGTAASVVVSDSFVTSEIDHETDHETEIMHRSLDFELIYTE